MQSKPGKFERAHSGTIFLDEIIELSPRAQAALLRVLQEGELERVGGSQTRKIDVRVVAATNENLLEAVQQGRFRADLYYRLNTFPVFIPPLRERRQDIPLLIQYFLKKYTALYQKNIPGISDYGRELLLNHPWPGNIRELENVIERGVILTDHNRPIQAEALFAGLAAAPALLAISAKQAPWPAPRPAAATKPISKTCSKPISTSINGTSKSCSPPSNKAAAIFPMPPASSASAAPRSLIS